MALQLAKEDDKRISEDECDFDFDNSTKPLCSTLKMIPTDPKAKHLYPI